MATYLKRTSKFFDISLSRGSVDVTLRDLMCPICRGILIEPVTLPCTHSLCLLCLRSTFEHNSFACPFCRLRISSWLRTATKSETLVNTELWSTIRQKFPKEVESKYNGTDDDARLESVTNRILCTAGEIRREYEAQLQLAQEEILRQREAERIASEALIRKIQAEEKQEQLDQLAQDKLVAKSLAKNQNKAGAPKHQEKCQKKALSADSNKQTDNRKRSRKDGWDATKAAVTFASRVNQYVMSGTLSVDKDEERQKEVPAGAASCSAGPSCSSSWKIYGLQSKEELRVPSDVFSSKKKTLDVEVCVTSVASREAAEARIGSAESSGSHDSINQEIHHFKPIKAVPRTALLLSSEGRQINPKVIRVIPIVKRVSNVVPQPPSPKGFKRIIGCSWSAFSGKARIEAQRLEGLANSKKDDIADSDTLQSPTAANLQQQSSRLPNHTQKSKARDSHCFAASQVSCDTNKNYTKSMNGIIKSTKRQPSRNLKKQSNNIGSKNKHSDDSSGNESLPDNVAAIENIAERIKRRKTLSTTVVADLSKEEKGLKKTPRLENAQNCKRKRHIPNESKRNKRQKGVEKCNNKKEKSKSSSASDEDEVIKEQKRIEKTLQQEKEDFELALRLQAQFNDLERLVGRTRGSRRARQNDGALSVPENVQNLSKKSSGRIPPRCRSGKTVFSVNS